MNYWERHIGDYIRDTVSLSMLEDGAYTRLLDQYYQNESPLPADKKEVYRLARATSTAERKAVDYVLQRYFELGADGFRQKRCDEVIEAFWDQAPAQETKRANERERQRRSRERRARLFEALRAHGVVPPFKAKTHELEAELSRVTKRDESQSVTRDDTATQTPDTNTQSPIPSFKNSGSNGDVGGPAPAANSSVVLAAVDVSRSLIAWERERGKFPKGLNASAQAVIDLSEQRVTVAELRAAYDDAVTERDKASDPNPINAGFVRSFVEKHRRPPPKPKTPPLHTLNDAQLTQVGRESGAGEARVGESRDSYIDRIKRKQAENSRGAAA